MIRLSATDRLFVLTGAGVSAGATAAGPRATILTPPAYRLRPRYSRLTSTPFFRTIRYVSIWCPEAPFSITFVLPGGSDRSVTYWTPRLQDLWPLVTISTLNPASFCPRTPNVRWPVV